MTSIKEEDEITSVEVGRTTKFSKSQGVQFFNSKNLERNELSEAPISPRLDNLNISEISIKHDEVDAHSHNTTMINKVGGELGKN
jgi:hypothetical protein